MYGLNKKTEQHATQPPPQTTKFCRDDVMEEVAVQRTRMLQLQGEVWKKKKILTFGIPREWSSH